MARRSLQAFLLGAFVGSPSLAQAQTTPVQANPFFDNQPVVQAPAPAVTTSLVQNTRQQRPNAGQAQPKSQTLPKSHASPPKRSKSSKRPKRLPIVSASPSQPSSDSAAKPSQNRKPSVAAPPAAPRRINATAEKPMNAATISNSQSRAVPAPVRPAASRLQSKNNPVTWLQSSTPSSHRKHAIDVLDQAMREYSVGAWSSAEASAWESLRSTAEAIDISQRNAGLSGRNVGVATADLKLACTALREAQDFAGKYGDLDASSVRRIVRSHLTPTLKQEASDVVATDAIDRYMNEAHIRLSRLAAYHVEAAQAIDLLAAIHLGRDDQKLLPNETSLCLRRAALQGQPQNADLAARLGMQLADLGLDQEAKWALEHSLAINPTEAASRTLSIVQRRVGTQATPQTHAMAVTDGFSTPAPKPELPKVVQLTPQQFASVSPPVMSEQAATVQANVQALLEPQSQSVTAATYRESGGQFSTQPASTPKKSAAQRLLSPFKKFW